MAKIKRGTTVVELTLNDLKNYITNELEAHSDLVYEKLDQLFDLRAEGIGWNSAVSVKGNTINITIKD